MPLILALLLTGCSEYDLRGKDRAGAGGDDTAPVEPPHGDDTAAAEACAELDTAPGVVAVEGACTLPPPASEDYTGVNLERTLSMPGGSYFGLAIAPLADEDGDGQVDAADGADIVGIALASGAAVCAWDGATGAQEWCSSAVEVDGTERVMVAAIGDLDGDGTVEVVVGGNDRVAALDGATGQARWVVDDPTARRPHATLGALGLYDLEGDGDVEVVVRNAVLDGPTGALVGVGDGDEGAVGELGPVSVAADLDLDGVQEILAGNAAYGPDGATLWANGESDGFPAPGNFDADPEGEVLVAADDEIRLQDTDGTVLWRYAPGGEPVGLGSPSLADLDGDGVPDAILSSRDHLTALSGRGAPLWTLPIAELTSGGTSSWAIDLQGDGTLEVLYGDEETLYILDAATGAVEYRNDLHTSGTGNEFPVPVDLDRDGHTEIVTVGYDGVEIFGDAHHGWQGGNTHVSQHAWSGDEIAADGRVASPRASRFDRGFRVGPLGEVTLDAPDAVPVAGEICTLDCAAGWLELVVYVGDAGTLPLPAGTAVSLYASRGGEDVWLGTAGTTGETAPGATSEGLLFRVATAAIRAGLIEVRVDDDHGAGAVAECDEADNTLLLSTGLCP